MKIAERIYRNTRAICQMKNLKLGEVESNAGLTVGYLSRGKAVGIEKCARLAEELGVTVDELLRRDYAVEAEAQKARKRLAGAVRSAKQYYGSGEVKQIVDDAMNDDE